MASAIGTPAAISTAAMTAAMAAVGPTDRSMPPEMMTSVMPSATQALIDDCCRMLRRLRSVRKFGRERPQKTTTIDEQADQRAGVAQAEPVKPKAGELVRPQWRVLVLDMAQDLATAGAVADGVSRLRHGMRDDGLFAQLVALELAGDPRPRASPARGRRRRRISGSSDETRRSSNGPRRRAARSGA